MSYDIYLKDRVTGKTLEVDEPHFMTGGTYKPGGNTQLWLNVTWNYANYYYEATDGDPRFAHDEISCYYSDGTTGPVETQYGIRGLYGKTGAESIPLLNDMISRIKDKYYRNGQWIEEQGPNGDYWTPTAANAIKPLYKLLAMAQMRPDGVWDGD